MADRSELDLTVAEVGERGTLARILPLLPGSAALSVGPGDDSAVVRLDAAEVVTTCDMMVEGPDFRRDWSSPNDIGYKAMTSNLADISAMGATPVGVIVALAAPTDTPVVDLVGIARGIARGLHDMAPEAGMLGGDLSTSHQLTLSVTVLGQLHGHRPVLRSGASAGDIVAVTGEPGRSQRGYELLAAATTDHGGQLPDEVRAQLVQQPDVAHHLAPRVELDLGPTALQAGATAMMDVSDGLLLDATRMAEASGVRIDFDGDQVVDSAWLTGGEDHGLLACFPADTILPDGFIAVGRVVELSEGEPRVTVGGQPPEADRSGWDPYRDSVTTRVSP